MSASKTIIIREGEAGQSAYELALAKGFVGTEEQWLVSLRGGLNGWSPVPALIADGNRSVCKIIDWTGGNGAKPASGYYVGPQGPTQDIAEALDLRGASGMQGPAGAAGSPGAAGAAGTAGPAGPAGAAGPQGPKGDIGDTGPAGPAGAAGPAGPQGAKGDTGDTGPAGPAGAAGPAGPQGAKGDTGDTGPAGPAGATGPAGPQGAKGDTGATGPAGATGATGPAGPQGAKGDTGAAGPAGAAGATGPTGPQGAKGDTGNTGAAGPAGPAGATGATGPAGPQGAKGDTGNTGAAGPTGPAGPAGEGVPSGGTAGQVLAVASGGARTWATPTRATVGLNTADDLPEKTTDPVNRWFTDERARAALESSNAAMATVLLADLPAAALENADRVASVRRDISIKRRFVLISDGSAWQYVNNIAVIDAAEAESADLTLTATPAVFSTGTIVIPGKLILPRHEYALDLDVLFQSASASNAVSVTANGTAVFEPPGTSSTRRYGGVCRLWMNAAGNGFRTGGHLAGFGWGTNSGGGYLSETAYTPGSDLTLQIRALGVVGEIARLWRWKLVATR
ncbi:hypothetical protein [Nevskia sp.]|uniref:hypothetical protein n=1 Tax=Nevskia sp. TaxID=1929292 RepID=UPI003F6F8FBB